MKKTILTLGAIAGFVLFAKAQEVTTAPVMAAPDAPEIVFEVETIDYGTIEKGANGVREFKFKNTGKSPLIITSAQGSCGCTVPETPKEPIPAGGTGVIKVKYDTERTGPINKSVTVNSNAKTPTKVLYIKGEVKAPPAAATDAVAPVPGVTPAPAAPAATPAPAPSKPAEAAPAKTETPAPAPAPEKSAEKKKKKEEKKTEAPRN